MKYQAKQFNKGICDEDYGRGRERGETAGDSGSCLRFATVCGIAPLPFVSSFPFKDPAGCMACPFCFEDVAPTTGLGTASNSSSGIGGQYVLSTCFSAGRLMGLDRKKSMPDSRHSYILLAQH